MCWASLGLASNVSAPRRSPDKAVHNSGGPRLSTNPSLLIHLLPSLSVPAVGGYGAYGQSFGGYGAYGQSFGGYGVYGGLRRLSAFAVPLPTRGLLSLGGYGAYGQSFGGYGAYGQSE